MKDNELRTAKALICFIFLFCFIIAAGAIYFIQSHFYDSHNWWVIILGASAFTLIMGIRGFIGFMADAFKK